MVELALNDNATFLLEREARIHLFSGESDHLVGHNLIHHRHFLHRYSVQSHQLNVAGQNTARDIMATVRRLSYRDVTVCRGEKAAVYVSLSAIVAVLTDICRALVRQRRLDPQRWCDCTTKEFL